MRQRFGEVSFRRRRFVPGWLERGRRGFARRLENKGITLVITDELVDLLVLRGYEPQFGARPMKRALQEHIEQAVARKIISGELKPGSRLELGEHALS